MGESRHRGVRTWAVDLVVLVECTLLSTAISREMAIQVTSDSATCGELWVRCWPGSRPIPWRCLWEDVSR